MEEYNQVTPLLRQALEAGGSYFLINRRWYVEWLQWVGHPDMQSPKMRPMPDPVAGLEALSPLSRGGATGSLDAPPDQPINSAAKRTRTHSWTKDRPGPIDNSELLEGAGSAVLRKTVEERSDYEIISEDAWNLLSNWYGGGPPIKRRAIQLTSGLVQVELHGLQLKVYRSSDANTTTPLEVIESKNTAVKDFKQSVCREMGLDPEKTRVWDYFNQRNYALLEKNSEKTLESCRIFDQNPILLEEQNSDGSWPHQETEETNGAGDDNAITSTTNGAGFSSSFASADVPSVGEPLQRGAVGLQNLGNTCFMNSSIQCLSNIPPLREFFLTEEFRSSLNRSAYKTQGKLAESFAALLGLMWREDTTRVAPRNFKWQVGQFAEQFSGYGQQDSMELIEYVLDGLKEDCNIVQGQKPYIEVKEADGRDDGAVAQEALENYKLRSNSRVDDLFVGLFKSVVKCPEPEESCGRASVTFDPFLSAKLPLVSSAEQRLTTFTVTYAWDSRPSDQREAVAQVRVTVSKDQNIKALIDAAAKEVEGLKPERCVLVEVWNKKVHKFFEDTEAVQGIVADDFLLLCEVADPKAFQVSAEHRWGSVGSINTIQEVGESSPTSQGSTGCIIYHRQACASPWSTTRELKGLPMLLSVSKQVTAKGLCKEVERKIRDTILEQGVEMPGWRLMRVDKYSPSAEGRLVDPQLDEALDLRESHEYFAVEWLEDSTPPPRLAQDEALKVNNTTSRGDGEQELSSLLRMFTEQEKLGADDAWYCSKCKDHKEAWKKLEFHVTPPVLVLQLKRFQFTRWSRERLNTPVQFPLEGLDLSPYCTESSLRDINADSARTTYDLAAFSMHIGSLGGGHYIAYCRSNQDGEWYLFDDGTVRKSSKEEVEGEKVGAYVLFYIRRDYRPACFGPPPASP